MSGLRGRGNVVIPKGFPKRVGRVGSRLHGFPPFPYAVISMACFSRGDAGLNLGSLPSDRWFILPSSEPKWPVIRPLFLAGRDSQIGRLIELIAASMRSISVVPSGAMRTSLRQDRPQESHRHRWPGPHRRRRSAHRFRLHGGSGLDRVPAHRHR